MIDRLADLSAQTKRRPSRLTSLLAGLILSIAGISPAGAAGRDLLSGRWRNAKGSVVVSIQPCGRGWCGVVVEATARAKERAREGGTPALIGTQVLKGVEGTAGNRFKGQVFDPKRNIRAPATLRLLSARVLEVRGCVFAGLICKEQEWTRDDR